VGQQLVERGIDGATSGRGEADQHSATIVRVGLTLHQLARHEAVDTVRHGAAGDERLRDQAAGGEMVRRSGATQRREDVELPGVEVVRGEGLLAGAVEVPREA
jgi:hypothetical protein